MQSQAYPLLPRLQEAFAGRYLIVRQLARGGVGTVYLARDQTADRDVAIKVLHPEIASALSVSRFLREIEIAGGLGHPNILPATGSGEADGLLYCVLPFVDGESLRDRLEREPQLPLQEARRIVLDIAAALDFAHARGVIHRDVKPGNVLLSGERTLLADFGIARALHADGEPLTASGVTVGTPSYMSPEQCAAEKAIDARSDLYSLACVLYEMLSGEPPFTGRTAQRILARHLHEPAVSVRLDRRSVPAHVDRALDRALQKSPADRFATVQEFVGALESAPWDPSTDTSLTRRLSSRRRLLLGVAATTAALAGIATWVFVRDDGTWADANKIVVFPLIDRTAGARDNGAGEAVAVMIGAALDQTDPLRWIDGWSSLTMRERIDMRSVSEARARRLTRAAGARYFIDGSIVGSGDSSAVRLSVHDALGDSLIAQTIAWSSGAPMSPAQLGLDAVRKALPRLLSPTRATEAQAFPAIAGRDPAAIAHWIQGELDYRRARFSSALGHLESALSTDSSLAIAALRGAEAALWARRPEVSRSLVSVALAREDRLPRKHVFYARGLQDYFAGRADSALAQFSRALAIDAKWSEVLMAAGEVYFHLLPHTGPRDSLAQARFLESWHADREFTPPLYHLSEIALREGRMAEAERLFEAFRATARDSAHVPALQLAVDCARHRTDKSRWVEAAHRSPGEAVEAARMLAAGAAYPDCAEDGYRALLARGDLTPGYRWVATIGLHSLLVAQGRTATAGAVVDSALAAGIAVAQGLFVLDAASGVPADDRAAAVVRGLSGKLDALSAPRLWFVGCWYHHRNLVDSLARAAAASAAVAARTKDARDLRLAAALQGRVSLAQGDTAAALGYFERLAPDVPAQRLELDPWESLGGERLLYAQLLLSRGRFEDARRAAAALDHPQILLFLLQLPASLSVRAAAARASGHFAEAARAESRLKRLRVAAMSQ